MTRDEREDWGRPDRATPDVERDVEDEIAFHLEMRVRENLRRGMSPSGARAEAERRFGSTEDVRREMMRVGVGSGRRNRWREAASDARSDVARAARALRRRPAFAAVTVLTLALGIGASTAVYSVAHRVLLRPVPGVRAPDSLVTVTVGTERSPDAAFVFGHADYRALRDAATALSGLAAAQGIDANLWLPGDARPRRVTAQYVAGDFAAVLGLEVRLGRPLTPADRDAPHVAVISHDLWTGLFDGSPDALGATLRVNGGELTVVGVAPPGFRGKDLLGSTDLWVPVEAHDLILRQAGADPMAGGYPIWGELVGRLRTGATVGQARAQLQAAAVRLASEPSSSLPDEARAKVRPGVGLAVWERDQLTSVFRVLGAVVGLLLLLACANAANLLLARVGTRMDELAIRRAIGAGRERIVRLLLTEAGLLTVLAGALGIGLAAGAVALFRGERFLTYMPPLAGVELEGPVLLFAVLVSGATGLLFGILPSLAATGDLGARLRSAGRGGSRRGPSRILVVAQVAISVTLVVGAGLLLNSLAALRSLELGFRPGGVVEASVDPAAQGYDDARRAAFFRELLTGARALPGAGAAGLAMYPVQGRMRGGDLLRPRGRDQEDPRAVRAALNQVSPGFVAAVGLELVAGRDFREEETLPLGDEPPNPGVAIVSETAAGHLFPSGSAVGRQIDAGQGTPRTLEIVGVVRDARLGTLKDPGGALVLEPLGQRWMPGWSTLYVRGRDGNPPEVGALHRLLRELDPALPLYDTQPLDHRLAASMTQERLLARLTSIFAVLALTLAAVGLYGMMAMVVQGRTREMGLRQALGAGPGQVRRLILRGGLRLTALGVVLGLLASTLASRLLESRLWGVSSRDPAVFLGAAAVLLAAAVVACWVPAVRATRVDPAEVLADE